MVWQQKPSDGAVHFPLQEIAAGSSQAFQPGNGHCPRLGWVVAVQSNASETTDEQDDLSAKLEVSFSAPGAQLKILAERFHLQDASAFLVPYPHLALTIFGGTNNGFDVAVSFYPVDEPELGVPYQSVLENYEFLAIDQGSDDTFTLSTGCTSWGFLGLQDGGYEIELLTVDNSEVATYTWDSSSSGAVPGNPTGIGYFPAIAGGKVKITDNNASPGTRLCMIVERFDFRAIGGA